MTRNKIDMQEKIIRIMKMTMNIVFITLKNQKKKERPDQYSGHAGAEYNSGSRTEVLYPPGNCIFTHFLAAGHSGGVR